MVIFLFGINRDSPIDTVLLSLLFILFSSSMVILNFLAIPYIVSPTLTIYSILSSIISSVMVPAGTFIVLPIVKMLVVKLFNSFNLSMVVLYLFAIPYRVSPFSIV